MWLFSEHELLSLQATRRPRSPRGSGRRPLRFDLVLLPSTHSLLRRLCVRNDERTMRPRPPPRKWSPLAADAGCAWSAFLTHIARSADLLQEGAEEDAPNKRPLNSAATLVADDGLAWNGFRYIARSAGLLQEEAEEDAPNKSPLRL